LYVDYVIENTDQNKWHYRMVKWLLNPAIRDTARVLDLPLFEADKIAKLIPGMMPGKEFGPF
jgi:DNA polymerase-3 subunit alpha